MSSAFSRYNNEKRQQEAQNVSKNDVKKAKYEEESSLIANNEMQYEISYNNLYG